MNTLETNASEGRVQTGEQDIVDTTMFPITGAAQTLADSGQPRSSAQDVQRDTRDIEEVRRKAEEALESAKQKGKAWVDKTVAMASEKQHMAAAELDGLARTLRDTANTMDPKQAPMAQGVQRVASVVEGLATTLREKDIKALVTELNHYAHQQPVVVLGGATVAGFLLARLLKSSAQRRHNDDYRPSGTSMS